MSSFKESKNGVWFDTVIVKFYNIFLSSGPSESEGSGLWKHSSGWPGGLLLQRDHRLVPLLPRLLHSGEDHDDNDDDNGDDNGDDNDYDNVLFYIGSSIQVRYHLLECATRNAAF